MLQKKKARIFQDLSWKVLFCGTLWHLIDYSAFLKYNMAHMILPYTVSNCHILPFHAVKDTNTFTIL